MSSTIGSLYCWNVSENLFNRWAKNTWRIVVSRVRLFSLMSRLQRDAAAFLLEGEPSFVNTGVHRWLYDLWQPTWPNTVRAELTIKTDLVHGKPFRHCSNLIRDLVVNSACKALSENTNVLADIFHSVFPYADSRSVLHALWPGSCCGSDDVRKTKWQTRFTLRSNYRP